MKVIFLFLTLLFASPVRAQVLHDVAQYVPLGAAVGLEYCGVEACHPLRERVALTATAFTALTGVAGVMKLTISEKRPDGSDWRSFPSGHAARAFAGAELVRSEYGLEWGLAAYGVATIVGVMRVAGDHHYVHDVVAGAAVGVAAARLAYWLLPFERKLFGWESDAVSIAALPMFQAETRSIGLSMTMTLH